MILKGKNQLHSNTTNEQFNYELLTAIDMDHSARPLPRIMWKSVF